VDNVTPTLQFNETDGYVGFDLREDYTDATVIYNNAKGVFRLATNITSWSINNSSTYGISFDAIEVLI